MAVLLNPSTALSICLALSVVAVTFQVSLAQRQARQTTALMSQQDEICSLELDVGQCTGQQRPERQRRFYFDSSTDECKVFSWTGCGGNENKFRTQQQCERRCKGGAVRRPTTPAPTTPAAPVTHLVADTDDRCPPICAMFCPHGFERDDDGCEICMCAEPLIPSSDSQQTIDQCGLRPMCAMFCPHGFVKDSSGCDLCRCAEDPTLSICASKPMCRMHCEHGYQKDADGCDICNCAQPPACASGPMCGMFCNAGFKKDRDGCYICECEEDRTQTVECSPVRCRMFCEHGFKRDDNGCEICRCNDPPDRCGQRPMCNLFCSDGFEKDENGCDLCRCAQPDKCALKPMCRMHCEHGYQKDADGCDLCTCAQPPECAARSICRMFCPTGFQSGPDGCYICRCIGDPADEPGVDSTIAENRKNTICGLQPYSGTCRAALTRWHYSSVEKKCVTFIYGGCRGNANNFRSEQACTAFCSPEVNLKRVEKRKQYKKKLGLRVE